MKNSIYMDAAASSLKYNSVIKKQFEFLKNKYANSGRGICKRSIEVDNSIFNIRERVARFLKANSNQIVFTSGATDGLNRIVRILDRSNCIYDSSNIFVSDLDHHSARLPWHILANEKKINISLFNLDINLNISTDNISKIDIAVITAMSNVIGNKQDVKNIIKKIKKINPNVITIVDACQYVIHCPIDVNDWDCDFLCFSDHKIGSDTGVGILYIKDPMRWNLDKFGGGMIRSIRDSSVNFMEDISRYEAGTLPLTQIIGLGEAIKELNFDSKILDYNRYIFNSLKDIQKIKFLSNDDSYILSFIIDDINCLDFGTYLSSYNICIRVGNMCASWLHKYLNCESGSIRISLGFWNTKDEVEYVVDIIRKILKS